MVYSTIIHDPFFIHYCCPCHMIDHRFHYFSKVGSNHLLPTPLHQVINYKLQVGLQHIKLHLPNIKNPLGYLDSLTTFEVSHCFFRLQRRPHNLRWRSASIRSGQKEHAHLRCWCHDAGRIIPGFGRWEKMTEKRWDEMGLWWDYGGK